jgi:hypothetical protein
VVHDHLEGCRRFEGAQFLPQGDIELGPEVGAVVSTEDGSGFLGRRTLEKPPRHPTSLHEMHH